MGRPWQLFRHTCVLLTILGVTVALPGQVMASSESEVAELIADAVAEYVKSQNDDKVRLERFSAPAGSADGSIRTMIADRLKTHDITCSNLAANWTLSGTISQFDDEPVLYVSVDLKNRSNQRSHRFRQNFNANFQRKQQLDATSSITNGEVPEGTDAIIHKTDDVGRIASTTTDYVTESTKLAGVDLADTTVGEQANQSVPAKTRRKIKKLPAQQQQQSLQNPAFHSQGSVIRASSSSQFGIEIIACDAASDDLRPLAPQDVGGRAVVDLQMGQRFAIRLYNDAPYPVGAAVYLDGVNSLRLWEAATSEQRTSGKWVIKPGKPQAITGFLINSGRIDNFEIGQEPEGVAAILGRRGDIGTIHVAFYRARLPHEEPSGFGALHLALSKGKAVTQGRPQEFKGTIEHWVFEEKQALATVSVLYENPVPDDLPLN